VCSSDLAGGDLGDVRHAEAAFTFRLVDDANYRWMPSQGGGALLDVGIYCLSPILRAFGGLPAEVIATLEKAWAEHIVNNEALKKYAATRGALFAPAAGEAAQTAAFPAVQANAWLLHAGGKTKVAPDTVGIAKP
jgi:predicted dehydrogenase